MRSACFLLFALAFCSTARADVLSGVVYRVDGKPADKATISIAAVFHAPPIRLTTIADSSGYFSIDAPKLANSERYTVSARWQTQGVDTTEALDRAGLPTTIKGEHLPTMTLRLRPEGRLRGKVLQAEDDRPIAGVKMFLDTGEVLTSDAEGAFELAGLPMKDHSMIPISPGRIRQCTLFDTTLQPEAQLEVRLPRGAIVRGTVTDEEGQPIPGAYLTRMSSGNALTNNGWNELCKEDGAFEYGGLSAERLFYGLVAIAPGHEMQWIPSEVKSSTDVIEKTIRLKKFPVSALAAAQAENNPGEAAALPESPRRAITGIVESDGQKIEGATIRWVAFTRDPAVKDAKTDKQGQFSISGVQGSGAVLILAAGYAPRLLPVADEKTQVTAQLSRGATYRGMVRGTSGQGVEGARVVAQVHAPETGFCNPVWLDERATRTDAKGEFTFNSMPVDSVGFDFYKQGCADLRNVQLKRGDGNEVQLSARSAIRGRVVDARFDPAPNFKIRIRLPRVRQANERFGGHSASYDWYGIHFNHYDGDFVFTGMEAHAWERLIVSSPGRGRAILDRVESAPLDQLPSADRRIIQLKPWVPLTVRVVDAKTGRAVEDAQVLLLEDAPELAANFEWGYSDLMAIRRRTNATGAAIFTEPACEDGTIVVTAAGFANNRIAWRGGPAEVKFSLAPAAAIVGEVRRKGELVREGAAQLVSSAKESFRVDLQQSEGRLKFEQLPAGEYQLSIQDSRGDFVHEAKVVLKEGETRTEKVILQAKEPRRQADKKGPIAAPSPN